MVLNFPAFIKSVIEINSIMAELLHIIHIIYLSSLETSCDKLYNDVGVKIPFDPNII